MTDRIACRLGRPVLALIVFALAACGGGGGDSGSSGGGSGTGQVNPAFIDNIAYSMNAGDSLPASQVTEGAAVMHYVWTSGGNTVSYTTTTGHLTASSLSSNPEATMSYVAYTAAPVGISPRPLTFFYNGGPGSSSIWLRLGSFAPTRVATPDPLMTNWPNFPLVDNSESLIATTDMVFIDPPGTGLSEAIQPNTNQTFWGSDTDVAVMRDFIRRYISVNNRAGSPLYLYGESYGTTRTNMLALSLESAGVSLAGIVLQSSILNYGTSNNDYYGVGTLPSFAAVAAYFNRVSPAPASLAAYTQQMQTFATAQYTPIATYVNAAQPVAFSSSVLANWSAQTDLTLPALNSFFAFFFDAEGWAGDTTLVPGSAIGRYDGRVSLPANDPRLASDSDPSDILIAQPFTNALATQMPNYLGYQAPNATYQTLNNAIIGSWNFTHAGRSVPDTIPDLLAALLLNPQLRVYSVNGDHDLATPFFQTEKELARLQSVAGLNSNIQLTFHQGGHMIYLDDTARPQMRDALVSFFQNRAIPSAVTLAQLPPPWPDQSSASVPTAVLAAPTE